MPEMMKLEDARELILKHTNLMPIEEVDLLDSIGRVAAKDQYSDIDVSPFAHAAMDGYAVRAADLEAATEDVPVRLAVLDEIAAGDVFTGDAQPGECIRIMTGAPLPDCFDSVVKYEIVTVVSGSGGKDSVVSFAAPTQVRSNVREAGEECHKGDVVISAGEVISCAGAGFLASCGVLRVPVYQRPRVAVLPSGSELVAASEMPQAGQIRNSNSYALAACIQAAGAVPIMLPIVEDTLEALKQAIEDAAKQYDFVLTSGGASNGDFDYIKPVVDELGTLLMSSVNMRPGKAQVFGLVHDTPVFGLPGNPAAAYCGFELIVRPSLRKMQGYTTFERPSVKVRLAKDVKKRDPRRMYMRGTLLKDAAGVLEFIPAKNQSSGLFGPIQKSNAMAVLPENQTGVFEKDSTLECILVDVSEDVVI